MNPIAIALIVLLAGGVLLAGLFVLELKKRHVGIWFADWMKGGWREPQGEGLTHVLFCFVDHYEPMWGKADYEAEKRRVQRWVTEYPTLCAGHVDADGYAPRHSFFYPEEEYREEHLTKLTDLCARGFGEIEIHLHHDNDTSEGLRTKLRRFTDTLVNTHQALPLDPRTGRPTWSFIHGNWALDNSHPEGRWCGVNDELIVLREEGCYADFTMPSAPDATQTSTVNRIYYAKDDPHRPKSHDSGVEVRVGGQPEGDLMILQGPLGLMWKDRKAGLFPRIENGDMRSTNPPTENRVDFWVRTGVHVRGRPDWIFVKIHTHGTQERDMDALLGEPVGRMFSYLESRYNDGKRYSLHYVSAREMYNIAKAAEAGETGNPGRFRDYVIGRPGYMSRPEYPHRGASG